MTAYLSGERQPRPDKGAGIPMTEISMIPVPRDLQWLEGTASDDKIEKKLDITLDDEQYRIEALKDCITLYAGSDAGLHRAEAALSQIRLHFYMNGTVNVTAFRLEDRPASADRPCYIDTTGKTGKDLEGEIRLAAWFRFSRCIMIRPADKKVLFGAAEWKKLRKTGIQYGVPVFLEMGDEAQGYETLLDEAVSAEEAWRGDLASDRTDVFRRLEELRPIIDAVLHNE